MSDPLLENLSLPKCVCLGPREKFKYSSSSDSLVFPPPSFIKPIATTLTRRSSAATVGSDDLQLIFWRSATLCSPDALSHQQTRAFPKADVQTSQVHRSARKQEYQSVAMSLAVVRRPLRRSMQMPRRQGQSLTFASRMIALCLLSLLYSQMTSAIVTLIIGPEQRIFAAHEDVLCTSPFFQNALRGQFMDSSPNKRVALPDEEPEVFSSLLEYLYKGDYSPRLIHNKKRNSWELEAPSVEGRSPGDSIVYHHSTDGDLLKDTVIYCAAEKYGLEDLKRIALRKQGLREWLFHRPAHCIYD
jgi:hypothetical protein